MSNKLAVRVKKALVKVFNRDHRIFMRAAEKSAAEAVKAINQSRVLGITLKELVQRENVTEGCLSELLRDLQGEGLELAEKEIAWLMNFVRVSNKLPGQLELFGDAPLDVRQITFQSANLLPAESAREREQISHEMTPVDMTWKCLADLRMKLEPLLKISPRWDGETRKFVIQNIDKTRKFLNELEARL